MSCPCLCSTSPAHPEGGSLRVGGWSWGRRVFGTARCHGGVVVGWLNARQCQVVGDDATVTPDVVTARQSRGERLAWDDWMRRSRCLLWRSSRVRVFRGSRVSCLCSIRDYRRRRSFGFKFLASDSETRDAVQDVCIELHRTVLVYDSCSPYTVSIYMFWSTASQHSISAPTTGLDGEGYHRFSDGACWAVSYQGM